MEYYQMFHLFHLIRQLLDNPELKPVNLLVHLMEKLKVMNKNF